MTTSALDGSPGHWGGLRHRQGDLLGREGFRWGLGGTLMLGRGGPTAAVVDPFSVAFAKG